VLHWCADTLMRTRAPQRDQRERRSNRVASLAFHAPVFEV
jgi:hypothetical protein